MLSGTWTLAWLLMTAGAAPSDVVYFNQVAIRIPLDIKPQQQEQIQEVILFSSADQGKNWHQEGVCRPSQDGFKFYAPGDGVYWFVVQAVDPKGNKNPEDIYQASPCQKVVIDMLKPQVRIVSTERKGEYVEVAWEIQEEHPDLGTLKLEYRTADAPASMWYAAPLEQPALVGRTRFRVGNSAGVSVRMQMQDLAQNLTITPATEVAAANGVTTAALTTTGTAPTGILPAAGASNGGTGGQAATGSEPKAKWEPPAPAPVKPDLDRGPISEGVKQVAATTEMTGTASNGRDSVAPPPVRGKLPALQVVKSKQLTLEYTLDKVGPSGIGSVELWLTQDDGVNWRRYAEDPDVRTPMPNGRYQRMVELPGEGVFGITLVVRSRAGLGKAAPRNGDVPQMRVEVDTTAPAAQLFVPSAEPGRRDALALTWTARDPNHTSLAANPITLQWAEHKGEWRTIAVNLPNTGRYIWQLPPNLPERVYLRLIARDAAGNEGIAETAEPQLVDLSEPEGTIVGIVP
jgi:hypothetical protein